MHRYHPFRQGVVVAVMIPVPLDPTTPAKRLKFTKTLLSPAVNACAKLFVPRRRYTLNVRVVDEVAIVRNIALVSFCPLAVNRKTPPIENMGKSVEFVTIVLAFSHTALVNVFDCVKMFVRASSSNKPFGAPVTESWSKRGVSAGAISMRPWEFTKVPMDARVNEGTGNVTSVGAMNGILLEMEVVDPIWVIGGVAM